MVVPLVYIKTRYATPSSHIYRRREKGNVERALKLEAGSGMPMPDVIMHARLVACLIPPFRHERCTPERNSILAFALIYITEHSSRANPRAVRSSTSLEGRAADQYHHAARALYSSHVALRRGPFAQQFGLRYVDDL